MRRPSKHDCRTRVVLRAGRWRCKTCDRPVRLREGEVAMKVSA